jgi:hypothetical protein
VAAARARIGAALERYEPAAPLRRPEYLPAGGSAREWTQGMALVHTLEELAQHHGQMEITRDVLMAGG